MFKLLIFLIILMFSSVISADVDTSLARYFPADTAFYSQLQTDQAQFAALDELSRRLNNHTTEQIPTFSVLMETLVFSIYGNNFQNIVRTWLGDSAAFGGRDTSTVDLMVIEITNRDNAIRFLRNTLARDRSVEYEDNEDGDFTIFTTSRRNYPVYAVGEDVMFIAPDEDMLPLQTLPSPSLLDDRDFQNSLELLSHDDYMMFGYLNLGEMLKTLDPSVSLTPAFTEELMSLDMQVVLALAVDDRGSIILDVVQHLEDISALKALGYSTRGTGAVNPDFLAYLPADTSFVYHGTDLKTIYELYENTDRASQRLFKVDANPVFDEIEDLFDAIGLDFKDDVLSWLSGDYALFLTYAPPDTPSIFASPYYPNRRFEMDLEFGMVFEVTDVEKAQALIEKLDIPDIDRDEIAGFDAITLSLDSPELSDSLDFAIASNDEVLVIGTRSAVTDILSGDGGFDANENFNAAESYLLDAPTMVWYADTNTVNLVGDIFAAAAVEIDAVFAEMMEDFNYDYPSRSEQQEMIERSQELGRTTATFFSAFTLSSTATPQGHHLLRLTITLAE